MEAFLFSCWSDKNHTYYVILLHNATYFLLAEYDRQMKKSLKSEEKLFKNSTLILFGERVQIGMMETLRIYGLKGKSLGNAFSGFNEKNS